MAILVGMKGYLIVKHTFCASVAVFQYYIIVIFHYGVSTRFRCNQLSRLGPLCARYCVRYPYKDFHIQGIQKILLVYFLCK